MTFDRSAETAARLAVEASEVVRRIDTDSLWPADIAVRLAKLVGWASDPEERSTPAN
ncbi:hypothetical protein SCMU_21030 [Sinomonas cyclohexanicum]|uniref:Uncharacterized protein n=1 Tax=Sinomonas cyclohexanicum TaxID=322009 RepID=A0ABN6FJM7_SINCY|nr:hypothetical protein SCMU_21030 [Corynebacterium cyclohexanicum]